MMINETQSPNKLEKTVSLEIEKEDEPTSSLPCVDNVEDIEENQDKLKQFSEDGIIEGNSSLSTNPISSSNIPGLTQTRGAPLSPVVISINSTEDDTSILVSSSPESDIYADIQAQGVQAVKNPPCPYLMDLKEHFITIGRRTEFSTKKSRGTFSPQPKTRTVLGSLRSTPNYQKI